MSEVKGIALLPQPADVRRELSRRVREARVLRRLLRVVETARVTLADPTTDTHSEGSLLPPEVTRG